MKPVLSAILTLLTLGITPAHAGTVCGTLTKANVCHTLQGCPMLFLHDPARGIDGNPYTVEAATETLQGELEEYADTHQHVCVTGEVGANGDPDILKATAVTARKSSQAQAELQLQCDQFGCCPPRPCI